MTISFTAILTILVAVAILLLGRQLYWLYVGIIGALVTFNITTELLAAQPEWLIFLIALAVGLVGAVLAIYLQYILVGLAGFAAGFTAFASIETILGVDFGSSLAFFAAVALGMVAAFFVVLFLDWGLIVLTSFTGASLLAETVAVDSGWALLVLVVAFLTGVIIQGSMFVGRTHVENHGRNKSVTAGS